MAKLGDTTVNGSLDVKGIVTNPTQPAFCAALTSNVYITALTTFITLAPWTERFDLGGDFNATTGIFTAPVTGKYQFNANVDLRTVLITSTYYWIRIRTSNGEYGNLMAPRYAANLVYRGCPVSALTDLVAGQQAWVAIYQYSGATSTTYAAGTGNTYYTSFSGFLAC